MIYILYGEDDFSIRKAIADIKKGLGDRELVSLNTTQLEGRQLSVEELRSVCETLPFLATKRLVIVEGSLTRFDRAARRGRRPVRSRAEAWQPLAEYIRSLPKHAVLVLVDGKLEESNPLLRALAPVAKVENFKLLWGARLIGWIQQRVAQAGGSIAPAAVRRLAELVGENLWAMSGEIDKLLLYAEGRGIEIEDVNRVASHAREANVFTFVDALLGRDMSVAGRELHGLLAGGATPAYLLSMITRQLRLLILAREILDNRGSREQIRQRLEVSHPFVLDKTMKQAQRFSLERLTEVYRRLLEVDLSLKTGRLPGEMALELFMVELSSRGDLG